MNSLAAPSAPSPLGRRLRAQMLDRVQDPVLGFTRPRDLRLLAVDPRGPPPRRESA